MREMRHQKVKKFKTNVELTKEQSWILNPETLGLKSEGITTTPHCLTERKQVYTERPGKMR